MKLTISGYMTETKYFINEISCYGEILEGILYSSSNYGDAGELFLDHLDFHKQTDDPCLLQDATNQEFIIKNRPIEIILKNFKSRYSSMFLPLHYCNT